MTKHERLQYTLYDMQAKPSFCRRFLRGVFCLFLLCSVMLFIWLGIEDYYRDFLVKAQKENSITVVNPNTVQWVEDTLFSASFAGHKIHLQTADVPQMAGLPEKAFLLSSQVGIQSDTVESAQKTGKTGSLRFEISFYDERYDMISQEERDYFRQSTGEALLLAGRMPEKAGEILLPQKFLSEYNLIKEETLYHPLRISALGTTILDNIIPVGIISDSYASESPLQKQTLLLYIYESPDKMALFPVRQEIYQLFPNEESFQNIEALINQSGMADHIFYNAEITAQITYARMIKKFSETMLAFIGGFLFLTLFLALAGCVKRHVADHIRFLGMLQAIGMKKKEVLILLLSEALLLLMQAVALAVLPSVLIYFAMDSAFVRIFGVGFSATLPSLLLGDLFAFLLTILTTILLVLVFSLRLLKKSIAFQLRFRRGL